MTIRVLICDDAADLRIMYMISLSDEPDIDLVGEATNGVEAVNSPALCYPTSCYLTSTCLRRTASRRLRRSISITRRPRSSC